MFHHVVVYPDDFRSTRRVRRPPIRLIFIRRFAFFQPAPIRLVLNGLLARVLESPLRDSAPRGLGRFQKSNGHHEDLFTFKSRNLRVKFRLLGLNRARVKRALMSGFKALLDALTEAARLSRFIRPRSEIGDLLVLGLAGIVSLCGRLVKKSIRNFICYLVQNGLNWMYFDYLSGFCWIFPKIDTHCNLD